MEIQKIYSDIEGNERIYSALLSEEELSWFSEVQKEFNSKSQKALRKVWDLRQGLAASGEKMVARGKNNPASVGEITDEIRGIGRRSNRRISSAFATELKGGEGLNHSINTKARINPSGNSVSNRIIDSETSILGQSRDYKSQGKFTRKAKGDQFEYDHPDDSYFQQIKNKKIMKKARGL